MRKVTIFAGDVFETTNGKVSVVEYHGCDCIEVVFLDTGFETTATAGSLRKGLVKDKLKPTLCGIGVLGVGPYSGKSHPKLYKTWNNMINRCYNENTHNYHPEYKVCSVDFRWHNFQNFCEDVQKMEGFELLSKGYHLDKDSKIPGNKVYSKDSCVILSCSENSRESANRRWNS